MDENQNNNQQQQELARLLNEVLFLQKEREALVLQNLRTLESRVAWSETCFQRMDDSGVIHMAGVIRKMVKDLEMLQVKHNKLSVFVRNHIPPEEDQGGSGGDDQSPLSTHLQKSMSKLGR